MQHVQLHKSPARGARGVGGSRPRAYAPRGVQTYLRSLWHPRPVRARVRHPSAAPRAYADGYYGA